MKSFAEYIEEKVSGSFTSHKSLDAWHSATDIIGMIRKELKKDLGISMSTMKASARGWLIFNDPDLYDEVAEWVKSNYKPYIKLKTSKDTSREVSYYHLGTQKVLNKYAGGTETDENGNRVYTAQVLIGLPTKDSKLYRIDNSRFGIFVTHTDSPQGQGDQGLRLTY